jgi:tyrosyl-tRNA synthetase
LIVTDFHSAEAAAGAQEEFTRVVRQRQVPSEIATVSLPEGVGTAQGIRVDKLLARIGLADSVSDAARKVKAGAVKINDAVVKDLVLMAGAPELLIQVGKHWRRVTGA